MPLSEHEQRLLDQIERALYAEDPKFASAVRSTDLKRHLLRRIKRAGVGFVLGLVLLLVGVATALLPVGVVGFLLMLLAGLVVLRSTTKMGSGESRPRSPSTRTSWRERIEQRFRRRFDD